MKTILSKNDNDFAVEISDISKNLTQDKVNSLNKILEQMRNYKIELKKQNKKSAIVRAIFDKKIYYKNNAFYGNFSLSVIKELVNLGAHYEPQRKRYRLEEAKLPPFLINAIIQIKIQNTQLLQLVNHLYNEEKEQNKEKANFAKNIALTGAISGIIVDAFGFVKKHIDKHNNITQDEYEDIKEKVNTSVKNMGYDIQHSSYENTKKMREKFFEAMQLNKNNKDLENIVKDHIQGTQKRVEFIVKQETRILLTNYQDNLMKQTKHTKFKWVCAIPRGKFARDQHTIWGIESNKGRIFDLNNLPINPITGKPDKPGQDYNCRCKMRIIVDG